jgi:hypothetical protein
MFCKGAKQAAFIAGADRIIEAPKHTSHAVDFFYFSYKSYNG